MTVELSLFEGRYSHGALNLTLNHFSHFNAGVVRFPTGAGTIVTAMSCSAPLALMHKWCHHYQPRGTEYLVSELKPAPFLPQPSDVNGLDMDGSTKLVDGGGWDVDGCPPNLIRSKWM